MPRYLIEMPHDDEHDACVRALDAVRLHGSHLITQTDWGCQDGVHQGWFIADCEDAEEARMLVPPELRHNARLIRLKRFTPEQIKDWLAELES